VTVPPAGHVPPADTAARERRRLAAQARLWDPFTRRVLGATGVTRGWRCLEIGAGTGSIAAWLVDRVGRSGLVVATDIEAHVLDAQAPASVVVRHHSGLADPGDDHAFRGYDLIHARLVLSELARRDSVVDTLAAALRPGGWLVVDEYDLRTIPVSHPPDRAWRRVGEAAIAVMQACGADPHFGGKLLSALGSAGLAGVTAEALVHPVLAPELEPVVGPFLEQRRDALLATGRVTPGDVDAAFRALHDEGAPLATYSPMLVSARGQRRPD
jgi:SAM-dependent methyltransferase